MAKGDERVTFLLQFLVSGGQSGPRDQLLVRHAQCLSELKDRNNRRVPLSPFKPTDVLLAEA